VKRTGNVDSASSEILRKNQGKKKKKCPVEERKRAPNVVEPTRVVRQTKERSREGGNAKKESKGATTKGDPPKLKKRGLGPRRSERIAFRKGEDLERAGRKVTRENRGCRGILAKKRGDKGNAGAGSGRSTAEHPGPDMNNSGKSGQQKKKNNPGSEHKKWGQNMQTAHKTLPSTGRGVLGKKEMVFPTPLVRETLEEIAVTSQKGARKNNRKGAGSWTQHDDGEKGTDPGSEYWCQPSPKGSNCLGNARPHNHQASRERAEIYRFTVKA